MNANLMTTAPIIDKAQRLEIDGTFDASSEEAEVELSPLIYHKNGQGNGQPWPRDLLEAYARPRGPYTLESAETILDEEAVELYNGWLVQQEMTDTRERRIVANINDMLSISARKAGFGQALPDQLECFISDGSVIKPDASLCSWQRLDNDVHPYGPRQRATLFGCPELVIEARSPSNNRRQERRKRELYFANRAQIVWDVDEKREEIWVYYAHTPNKPRHFRRDDEIDCEPLLPGWRRRMADIFAEHTSAEAIAGEVADTWRNEGVAVGKQEGIAIGKQEGEQLGLRRGLLAAIELGLELKFGEKGLALLAEIPTIASIDRIQLLYNAVKTANSVDDLRALFQSHQ